MNVKHIDDYLGKSDNRYFGSGYKKTIYKLEKSDICNNEIKNTYSIFYPTDWSKKKGKLNPHLSSVDVIILTLRMFTLYKNHVSFNYHDLMPSEIIIRSSKIPLENLDNIECFLKVKNSNDLVTLNGKIGNMNVQIILNKIKDEGYYNIDGFEDDVQIIKNINFISGEIATSEVMKYRKTEKLNIFNVLDSFLVTLQLGQVLLYKIDNIKREDSNNLWMRDLHIRMNNKNNVDDKVCVKLEDNELIEMNQECWRCSNIKGTMGDFIINCKVTHKLGQKNYVCKN